MSSNASHITTSGGLMSAAFIESIRELNIQRAGVEPESFSLPWREVPRGAAALEQQLATAWELLREQWDAVRAELPKMGVSDVRRRWLIPLFELLDFEPHYLRADTVIGESNRLRFSLSHRGWNSVEHPFDTSTSSAHRKLRAPHKGIVAPVLHTVAPTQELDERVAGGRGFKGKSPHDMVQVFLNVSQQDRWAVLSNGVMLRLLRDYHHTFTQGYVQFDLESIFETRNFGDFRALYRLCHASRFMVINIVDIVDITDKAGAEVEPLERFYKEALATGVKVGDDLRGQVRSAIETLGNGFLAQRGALIGQLQDDAEACRAFYGEILRVVYRILFLLFAEQRGMIPRQTGVRKHDAPLAELYREQYSITALRTLAEGDLSRHAGGDFTDLWEGLQVTFQMVRDGVAELGIFGYNGMLFDDAGSRLLLAECPNNALLRAIRDLTLIERERVLQRISYADLGVEELGSIYESLLDFTPRVSFDKLRNRQGEPEVIEGRKIAANTFFLDPRGMDRKTSGSYYTHPSLVNELIKSALLPVMWARLGEVGLPVIAEDEIAESTTGLLLAYAELSQRQREQGAEALLNLKICDPAAGSGHFLVRANNVLGAEVARVRSGDDYPTENALQLAKRDVMAGCIYAVDLNPMAVELCRVSLWINASVRDQKLNFLDHHIKCGNSLVGATPELLKDGISADAFALGRIGDDRAVAKRIRKQNRKERRDWEKGRAVQRSMWRVTTVLSTPEEIKIWSELNQLAAKQPELAREQYESYQTSDHHQRQKLEADFWTAAFFWPMPKDTAWAPTFGEFRRLRDEGEEAIPPAIRAKVADLAQTHHFFHWHLEFPDVFGEEATVGSAITGGFDVILGNPPWERIKLQEKEFFANRDEAIANASTAAKRRKLIKALPKRDPELYHDYQQALHFSEASSNFLRKSGRYPLSAKGDINTYQIFAGLVRQIKGGQARVGIILPSGIATDYYNQEYFNAIVEQHELVSLYDFENREGIFPGVHRSYKFCLLTLTGANAPAQEIDFAFFLLNTDHLMDEERHFTLTKEELRRINPNTGTCPIFRSKQDAELTKAVYRQIPVLIEEGEPEKNPWGISFLRMFDMANDSGLFRTREELEASGWQLVGNRFVRGEEVCLPLYEAKMFHQFDHRWATYNQSGKTNDVQTEKKNKQNFVVLSRYWLLEQDTEKRLNEKEWKLLFCWRDICRNTDERTLIAGILSQVGCGDTVLLAFPSSELKDKSSCFHSNLNSFVLDYCARQKIGGTHLKYHVFKQLPVLPPQRYCPAHLTFIVPRVLELTYTAWDIVAFADDVWREADEALQDAIEGQWQANVAATGGGHAQAVAPAWVERATDGFPYAPFMWDEERRAQLRADLDGLYGHLYGLTRDEFAYILDTFPIVRRKDEKEYGEYRTKRMVLEAYDGLAGRDLLGWRG